MKTASSTCGAGPPAKNASKNSVLGGQHGLELAGKRMDQRKAQQQQQQQVCKVRGGGRRICVCVCVCVSGWLVV